VNFLKPSLPVVEWTLQTGGEIMLDQQVPVLGLHVTFSSLARALGSHPEITWSGLEAETNAACDHSDIQAAYSAWWDNCETTHTSMDTESCVAR
jgi:hypothetical protein